MLTTRQRSSAVAAAIGAVLTLAVVTPASAVGEAAGAPRWSKTVEVASLVTGPALGGSRAYVGFTAPDGTGGVRALDVTTGATVWTRNVPLPVTVPPVFVPSSGRLYAATVNRLYALDPATGATIVATPMQVFYYELYNLQVADGRIYVQTVQDLAAFTPAMVEQWHVFLGDDPSRVVAPGDGFLYLNEEGLPSTRQCMKKLDAATAAEVARNCSLDDFLLPSVAKGKAVVGSASDSTIYAFRTTNLSIRWHNTSDVGNYPIATTNFGGKVAVAGSETVSMLRLSDGSRICRKSYDERIFVTAHSVFDPVSGGMYTFDVEANNLYKVGPDCLEDWRYPVGGGLAGLAASKTNVVGSSGTTVFALVP